MSELSGLARKRGIWSLRRRRSRLSLSVKRPLDADIVIDLIVWHGLCPWNTTPFRWRSSHCMVMPCSGEYLAGRLYGVHISWKPAAMDSQAPSPLSNAS